MGRRRSSVAAFLSRGEEAVLRGWFVVNALKRLSQAEDKRHQFDKEKTYFKAHTRARERRRAAADMVDAATQVYGPTLGWYSVLDNATTGECRSAHGKNFRASRKPRIGYPSVVHPHCRCSPGAPWPNGSTLR